MIARFRALPSLRLGTSLCGRRRVNLGGLRRDILVLVIQLLLVLNVSYPWAREALYVGSKPIRYARWTNQLEIELEPAHVGE